MNGLSKDLTQTDESIITDFDHEAEARRKVRIASTRRVAAVIHLVLLATVFVVAAVAWIRTQDFEMTFKDVAVLLFLISIAEVVNTILELNLRPPKTVLTRKISDLPRLLRKAKSVAELHPTDEYHVAGVWNSLDYLTKHLYPHHRREISDETITHLIDLLSTETLSSRLKTLLGIASICANTSLLPSLESLHKRSGEVDQEGTLAGPLASAIESCSQPESQSAHAIGGLTR